MSKQNNFSKIPLFISTIFFCISLFFFLFLYRTINNNSAEAQLRGQEWQTEASRRDEVRVLEHSVKIIEGERAELETHFAQSSDIVPFLDTIEGLAPKAGVKAEVVSVDISKDNTGLMVGMKASGTFNSLYKFLTLLENSPYELEFTKVDLRRETEIGAASKGVAVPKWNAVFEIKLLSFVQ